MTKPELKVILFKKRGKFFLAACRGEAKGCRVKEKERQKMGPCEFCMVLEDENETIGSVMDRLKKGDA